mgnify:CR=1 FL=1
MRLRNKYYIVVSGSNGKTTTVNIIYHVLKNIEKVVLCGNIGYSFCRALVENKEAKTFIIEASSFQLENSIINPNISLLLNINPCHIDHHLTLRNYVDSKQNITINQTENDVFIYNLTDQLIKKIEPINEKEIINIILESFWIVMLLIRGIGIDFKKFDFKLLAEIFSFSFFINYFLIFFCIKYSKYTRRFSCLQSFINITTF